jgi:hypothetical protein
MRITDAPFSQQEADAIRRMLMIPGALLLCPRCSSVLADAESVVSEGALAVRCRLIRCSECRRMVTVSN